MKKTTFNILNLISLLLFASCGKNVFKGDLILANVNIVDVEKLKIHSNQTVVINDNKIISIAPYSSSHELNAKTIIDGTEKYVIPGLWDMHTHYTTSKEYQGFLNLFIANGVLGVRDLWGNLQTRDSLVVSKRIIPRIFLSGEILDGPFTLL